MAATFLENYSKVNKRSWKRDEISVKNLTSFFAGRHLYEINNLDIENYKKIRIKQGVSYATINRELACLRTILNKAVEWNLLSTNPPKIKLYKENNQRTRYLTKEEENKILEVCPDVLKPIILIALNTGMRRSEIAKLRWQDIDFREKMITVYETKNNEKRHIPMNTIVFDTINRIKEKPFSQYLFPGENGSHISPHHISHLFEKTVKKAGIKDFRFHDLRHTFASRLVMNGVDLKTVQELLGHKSFNMTLRYSHLAPEHKRKAVEILEKSDTMFCGLQLDTRMQKMDTIWTPAGKDTSIQPTQVVEK
ncbi:MAG: site-specific integrase [Candidatus Omnitrophica bacterium]|nr:site-specific integrase [Candidatus Omnitrophota bacterium]